jgi:hypothetical protein
MESLNATLKNRRDTVMTGALNISLEMRLYGIEK